MKPDAAGFLPPPVSARISVPHPDATSARLSVRALRRRGKNEISIHDVTEGSAEYKADHVARNIVCDLGGQVQNVTRETETAEGNEQTAEVDEREHGEFPGLVLASPLLERPHSVGYPREDHRDRHRDDLGCQRLVAWEVDGKRVSQKIKKADVDNVSAQADCAELQEFDTPFVERLASQKLAHEIRQHHVSVTGDNGKNTQAGM